MRSVLKWENYLLIYPIKILTRLLFHLYGRGDGKKAAVAVDMFLYGSGRAGHSFLEFSGLYLFAFESVRVLQKKRIIFDLSRMGSPFELVH